MEIVFLIVGAAFLLFGLLAVGQEWRSRQGAVPVPGRIAGYALKAESESGRSFSPVVEFVGIDGRRRYVVASVGSSAPMGRVGDALPVLLRPDDPEKASVKSALSYVLGGILASVGALCCWLFFRIFHPNFFSIGGAVVVCGTILYKLSCVLREKPLSWEAWRRVKEKALGGAVFTDETKAQIPWAEPDAVAEAEQKSAKAARIAAPLLLLIGAGLMALGYYLYGRTSSFLATAVPASGVVVDLKLHHSSDGSTYSAVVEFERAGQKRRFTDSISSSRAMYRRGDAVKVLLDPEHPDDARIDRGAWNLGIPLAVGAAGLLTAIGGMLVLGKSGRAGGP